MKWGWKWGSMREWREEEKEKVCYYIGSKRVLLVLTLSLHSSSSLHFLSSFFSVSKEVLIELYLYHQEQEWWEQNRTRKESNWESCLYNTTLCLSIPILYFLVQKRNNHSYVWPGISFKRKGVSEKERESEKIERDGEREKKTKRERKKEKVKGNEK